MQRPPDDTSFDEIRDRTVPVLQGGLLFDDEPIERALVGEAPLEATPASAIALWSTGIDRSEACGRAVAAILATKPEMLAAMPGAELEDLDALLSASLGAENLAPESASRSALRAGLAVLAEARGDVEAAEEMLRRAWEERKLALGPNHTDTTAAAENLADLLDRLDRGEEAEQIRTALAIEVQVRDGTASSLRQARAMALQFFEDEKYDLAETIYRRLVEEGFELASSHCHLARVFLMTDKEHQAREQVKQAAAYLDTSEHYVTLRVLFLQVLDRMREKRDATTLLRGLRRAIYKPGAHLPWSIDSVLEHQRPRLSERDHELLDAIASAISDAANLADLESLSAWDDLAGEADENTYEQLRAVGYSIGR